MTLHCRFSNCAWQGGEDEIFEHFELQHKMYLREPKGQLYYDFSFEDLQQEAFVLCLSNNLYYLRQNLDKPRSGGMNFGVFHIGESEQVEFTLKLGSCKYWGPFQSKKDVSQYPSLKDFNLNFDFKFLEMLNESIPSRRLRLYFGKLDDSDDKLSPANIEVNKHTEEERLNRLFLEQFTCAVCFEFIRHNARFCENQHFICLNCFYQMQRRKNLKCPICRGQYLYDCSDDQVECLLSTIKWPDITVAAKANKKTKEISKTLTHS